MEEGEGVEGEGLTAVLPPPAVAEAEPVAEDEAEADPERVGRSAKVALPELLPDPVADAVAVAVEIEVMLGKEAVGDTVAAERVAVAVAVMVSSVAFLLVLEPVAVAVGEARPFEAVAVAETVRLSWDLVLEAVADAVCVVSSSV